MSEIMEIIKEYGLVVSALLLFLCACLLLVKKVVSLTVEKIFSEKSSKKIQLNINQLNRRTLAYEILLKKELEYYDNISDFISEIVVLIQDVCWNYEQINTANNKKTRREYNKTSIDNFVKILKLIPKTKKDNLMFENYSDRDITKLHANVIFYLQNNAEEISEILKQEKYFKNNYEILKNISHEVLKASAALSTAIQARQKQLSE